MCTMCHFCGEELTKLEQNRKNREATELDGRAQNLSCRFCGETQDQVLIKQVSLSPSRTPMISPTTSLSSSDSSVSSCSEFSIDVNSYDRGNQENIMYVKDPNNKVNTRHQDPCSEGAAVAIDGSDSPTSHKFREGISGSFKGPPTSNGTTQTNHGHEVVDNTTVDNKIGYVKEISSVDKIEEIIWDPPEPEDPENDLENSVAYNDDDDECGDGTKWGEPVSLSSLQDEGSGSYKYKEEKQREMEEVINGKFRELVRQLLGSMGIASSPEAGESWEDIVTSLSWKVASLFKPEAIDGKAMAPDGNVKIKCIATGTRSQSQVIRGLVFKKHAAHKHMPTHYKNAKLLLLQGVLGQSSSGLSSFESMEQEEKDHLNSIIEKIEMCQPNVILVEKTVSRDAQESILKKGMTLVFDMKMHRLERIARYTDSSVLSTEMLTVHKLKQCESFRIEKFVEEHAGLGEGGKKPRKTLMFIEGCPMKLGCTILLRGSHSNELKKIKSIVQYSVIMAYHLILETSFLVDQRVMFSTIPFPGIASALQNDQPSNASRSTDVMCSSSVHEESAAVDECCAVDIPISNGTDDGVSHDLSLGLDGNSPMSYEPYNPIVFSGFSSLSASLRKVIGESYPSLSSYLVFHVKEPSGHLEDSITILAESEAALKDETEISSNLDVSNPHDERQTKLSSAPSEVFPDVIENGHANQMETPKKSNDNIKTVLDSQSILVLMSRRNALRGTVCEQSHFSRITFYRSYDIPLGKFLRDNILNQRTHCTACGELPEAHFYYYAHHSKQLTIQVRRLCPVKRLPGEEEGKVWMWSCCSKCTPVNGIPRSTKRVLISTAARALSFGKFLELSFSQYTSSMKLSNCGHSLQKDFLHFFGMGSLVAMFRYAPVTTYTVSMPPQKLDFSNALKSDWIQKEIENVYAKGVLLFKEVANSLKRLGCQVMGSSMHHCGLVKQFSDVENILRQESCDFELCIQNIVKKVNSGHHGLLNLNQALWNLLLEAFIWDKRLNSLVCPGKPAIATSGKATQERFESYLGDALGGGNKGREKEEMLQGDASGGRHNVVDLATEQLPVKEIPVEDAFQESHECPVKEIPIDGPVIEVGLEDAPSNMTEDTWRQADGSQSAKLLDWGLCLHPDANSHRNSIKLEGSSLPNHLQTERSVECKEDSDTNTDPKAAMSPMVISIDLLLSDSDNSNVWFWRSFSEIRKMYLNDLRSGRVPKFEFSSPNSEYFTTVQHLISEESSRIRIPLDNDNYLVSDYEAELSSLIACALALLTDQPIGSADDSRLNGGTTTNKAADIMQNLIRVPSMSSTNWSSSGSLDSMAHSPQSIFSMDSRLSSFDGLMSLDSSFPSENLKAEVSLGVTKSLVKGKYSVVCLYADQFRDLRNWCCPSELDFIASLSRCRNWDAKGGKSKSFFAKTLDDRFIIKEIKRTEFDSFDKFAPHYFKHMKQSFESGNQTCLAKVLGIYQVTIRQSKSGKEVRHDLMVMENLTFGRNIMRQYDLKGALHARFNSVTDVEGDVLLDQNFVNDMNSSPLYVSNKAKHLLQRAVWNDTSFLNSINVMDYSLLVGVDVQKKELVCGIIDYLRQYTWDKQLETWVKSSLYVPKNVLPTVISPKEYKKRFRKFMSAHFLCIPDNWCLQDSPDACDLCGDESSCMLNTSK